MTRGLAFFLCVFNTLFLIQVHGQKKGTCGEVLPDLQERSAQKEALLKWKTLSRLKSTQQEVKTIPVVFHFIDNDFDPLLPQIENLLDKVNQGFANEDGFATDYGIDANIRFCLVKTAPDGGVTDGINLVKSRYEDFDKELELADLLGHIGWNFNRYLNIWVVNQTRAENPDATYYIGKKWWIRSGVGAFVVPGKGIVLSILNPVSLIHELGHYFGLLHTFEGLSCENDDCLVDGDMICDTPPDKSVINSCGDNSCDTDTLSNFSNLTFFKDTLDMGTNFMDYGGCPIEFSHGQIERMRFMIRDSFADLPEENNATKLCNQPCDIESIGLSIDQDLVITGQQVTLTPSDLSYDHYEWYINPTSDDSWISAPSLANRISTAGTPLAHTFTTKGWHTVHIKAWNDPDATCFTSFSRNVMVTCGVDARFSPNIREIASKQPDPLFTDSVRFVNYSVGANSYEWTVKFSERSGATPFPDFKSSNENLTYVFNEPGEYAIQLSASDGTCTDQSNIFNLSVADPTMDGSPVIDTVYCVNEDSILVQVTLYNYGFDTINAGSPISFYREDPRINTGDILLESLGLPKKVYGLDQQKGYEKLTLDFYIKTNYELLDSVFVVFNDIGKGPLPIRFPPGDKDVLTANSQFPPSGLAELTYDNNYGTYAIKKPGPLPDITACPGDKLILADSLCKKSVTWDSMIKGKLGMGSPIDYVVSEDDRIVVTTESSNGEIARDTFFIRAALPRLDIIQDTYKINKGESAQLQVSYDTPDSISWSPESTLDNPFIGNPRATPLSSTTYKVAVTNEFKCTSSGEINVFVISKGYIPNLFTPNGDGRNDKLLIYGLGGIESISFRILNRAGNTVYSSTSPEELKTTGWDGNWNGVLQTPGAFFWRVSGNYRGGTPLLLNNEKKGIIHLVR